MHFTRNYQIEVSRHVPICEENSIHAIFSLGECASRVMIMNKYDSCLCQGDGFAISSIMLKVLN